MCVRNRCLQMCCVTAAMGIIGREALASLSSTRVFRSFLGLVTLLKFNDPFFSSTEFLSNFTLLIGEPELICRL